MNSTIQARYEPNRPRFRSIHLSAKATVANTHRLARPNPIAPVTIDFDSEGRGLDSVNIGLSSTKSWYADERSGCRISSICGKYSSQKRNMKRHTAIIASIAFSMLITIIVVAHHAPTAYMQNDWTEPFPAFRIAGNLYYVGSRGLASYLTVSYTHLTLPTSD